MAMKKKKGVVSILLAVVMSASLGMGAASVYAEPDDPDENSITEQSSEINNEISNELSLPEESSFTEQSEPVIPYEQEDSSNSELDESSYEEDDPVSAESSEEEYESEQESDYQEESSEGEPSEESSTSEVTEISQSRSESSVGENSSYSGSEYSDNSEMTPEDWEQQKNRTSIREEQKKQNSGSGAGEFDTIKNDSDSADEKNDDWIYLAWGIVLISVGVLAIAAVIISSIYSKRKLKKQHSEETARENSAKKNTLAQPEKNDAAESGEQLQNESRAAAKRNTEEIDINELIRTLDKDDYNDSFDK